MIAATPLDRVASWLGVAAHLSWMTEDCFTIAVEAKPDVDAEEFLLAF